MEEKPCNRVVPEIEILKMNKGLGLANSLKQINELVVTSLEQFDGIAIIHLDTPLAQVLHHNHVGGLGTQCGAEKEWDSTEYD